MEHLVFSAFPQAQRCQRLEGTSTRAAQTKWKRCIHVLAERSFGGLLFCPLVYAWEQSASTILSSNERNSIQDTVERSLSIKMPTVMLQYIQL